MSHRDPCATDSPSASNAYTSKPAYLQGKGRRLVIARAPIGHRKYDEDGVEFYWLMKVPLYGQPDAGLCRYESIDEFLTDDSECRFSRGEVEPCVYDRRVGSDGSEHVNMNLYVDDGLTLNETCKF